MRQNILLIIFLVFLATIGASKTNLFLDPDFGWHIRTGQYILEHDIPYTDPFSYTMPSFPFIAHSWLSEANFYLLYQRIGYAGLSWIISLLAIATLLITQIASNSVKKLHVFIPLGLGFSALLSYLSVRPQSFSWLFFALFLAILLNKNIWQKYRLVLPIIMIVWVNMHGAFAIGIALFVYVYAHRIFNHEKLNNTDKIIFVSTLIATCVNPYGLHIWREAFSTFADIKLRTHISEWSPLFFKMSFFHIPILALSLVLAIRYYKLLPRQLTNIFFFLLFLGITSIKLFPIWIIVAVYLISISLTNLEKTFKKNPLILERYNLFLVLMSAFSIGILMLNVPLVWDKYKNFKEDVFYPQKAVAFIESHSLANNVFTSFNWGGYSLWKMPTRKVFVDGRMPYWQNTPISSRESTDTLAEYGEILSGSHSTEKVFNKYNIQIVLIPKKDLPESFQKLRTHMNKLKWPIIYEDDVAIIYNRPN